jgi:hypothetical protein
VIGPHIYYSVSFPLRFFGHYRQIDQLC